MSRFSLLDTESAGPSTYTIGPQSLAMSKREVEVEVLQLMRPVRMGALCRLGSSTGLRQSAGAQSKAVLRHRHRTSFQTTWRHSDRRPRDPVFLPVSPEAANPCLLVPPLPLIHPYLWRQTDRNDESSHVVEAFPVETCSSKGFQEPHWESKAVLHLFPACVAENFMTLSFCHLCLVCALLTIKSSRQVQMLSNELIM